MRSIALILAGVPAFCIGAEPSFLGLGDIGGGEFRSSGEDVSRDGSAVVVWGRDSEASTGARSGVWKEATGIVEIGFLEPSNQTGAQACSLAGAVIVGSAAFGNESLPFRWDASGGMKALLRGDGSGFAGEASDVSDDGSVVVGFDVENLYARPFRWTEAAGAVPLPGLPGNPVPRAQPTGISSDGSVVVGLAHTGLAAPALHVEAVKWDAAGNITGLGALPGQTGSFAISVSGDGATVCGWGSGSERAEAFLLTPLAGMFGLGDLPGSNGGGIEFNSYAADVSDDGFVVVGYGNGGDGLEATVWDPIRGMRSLKRALQDIGVGSVDGWHLEIARAVSADGTVIVGRGTNPAGQTEAWRAILPRTGLSPLNPIRVARHGDALYLGWDTESGKTYQLECSSDLVGMWQTLGGVMAGNGEWRIATFPFDPERKFFRVVANDA